MSALKSTLMSWPPLTLIESYQPILGPSDLSRLLVKVKLGGMQPWAGWLKLPILRVLLGDKGQRDRETRTGLQCTVEKSIWPRHQPGSAVHSVLKHKTRANCKLSVYCHKRDKGICLWWDKTKYWRLSWVIKGGELTKIWKGYIIMSWKLILSQQAPAGPGSSDVPLISSFSWALYLELQWALVWALIWALIQALISALIWALIQALIVKP